MSASASGDDDGGGSGGIIAIIAAAVLVLGGGAFVPLQAEERGREGVTAGFISKKVLGALVTLIFVVCFNFFLFRVVDADPVANLFRGKELSQTPARRAAGSSSG